jgi:alpha-tubulin suppressor-like RCC1 family protein
LVTALAWVAGCSLLNDFAPLPDEVAAGGAGSGGAGGGGNCGPIRKLVSGDDHGCALYADGALWCWGENEVGQIGDGTVGAPRPTPVRIEVPGKRLVELVAGAAHNCARADDGTVWCWGWNDHGQLGNGGVAAALSPIQVAALGNEVASIGAGAAHTCAVKKDGALWCWGLNEHGQLGDGTTQDHSVPAPATAVDFAVAEVVGGADFSCARTAEGSAWCWGNNSEGQLGNGSMDPSLVPVEVHELGFAVAELAATGAFTACALKKDGTLSCWGDGDNGQIGDGLKSDRPTPAIVGALGAEAVAAAPSDLHTCALKKDGTVWCWGINPNGQLGDGTTVEHALPAPIPALSDIDAVAVGENHSCAHQQGGTLWCWGRNDDGQLGTGEISRKTLPAGVPLSNVGGVVAGRAHTCARQNDGTAWCWGRNDDGELGDGTKAQSPSPVKVQLIEYVAGLTAGDGYGCAVKTGASLWCWGRNDDGQLGIGTMMSSGSPVHVMSLDATVLKVVAGGAHTCALKNDQTLWCWGANDYGQLGSGTNDPKNTPFKLTGVVATSVVDVAVGAWHTCARKGNTLWCWGRNDAGQLGSATADPGSLLPVQVPSFGTLKPTGGGTLAAGANHTCAVLTDGALYCWGDNSVGQIGDGATGGSLPPTVVGALGDEVDSVRGGGWHTCARKIDDTLWCWGSNEHGQLGIGTVEDHATPVQANVPGPVKSFATGAAHTCAVTLDGELFCWGEGAYGQIGDGTVSYQASPAKSVLCAP